MTTFTTDLRQDYGPARDQGKRQTCLAFAASDANALVHMRPSKVMSAEYAHYQACRKMSNFAPEAGTTAEAMFAGLHLEGQPLEPQWPYLKTLPADLSLYTPPVVSPLFHHEATRLATLQQSDDALREKWPVVIGFNLTASFFGRRTLDILEADPDLNIMGRHAVLAIGLEERAIGNAYLIRNSWGTRWGADGHALLSKAYIEPRLLFMGVFRE